MQVSIWWLVVVYVLGCILAFSFLVDQGHRERAGVAIACALWPAIVVIGVVTGVLRLLGVMGK